MTAVISEATQRASTIAGSPGKATAVATSTTGLMAGADSMNVSAAAPVVPSPNSRRATGTDPHSQPGRAAPPTPATATAIAGRRGSQRASLSAETKAAISPLITTPSTRNGSACTKTPQNTVAATARSGLPATNALIAPAARAIAMSDASKSSIDPTRLRRRVGVAVTAPSCRCELSADICPSMRRQQLMTPPGAGGPPPVSVALIHVFSRIACINSTLVASGYFAGARSYFAVRSLVLGPISLVRCLARA